MRIVTYKLNYSYETKALIGLALKKLGHNISSLFLFWDNIYIINSPKNIINSTIDIPLVKSISVEEVICLRDYLIGDKLLFGVVKKHGGVIDSHVVKTQLDKIILDPINFVSESEEQVFLDNEQIHINIDNKYYLPIIGVCNGSATNSLSSINYSTSSGDNVNQKGVILNSSYEVLGSYNAKNIQNNYTMPVKLSSGEVGYVLVNRAGPLLFYTGSQVISEANLDTPIYKGLEDILRITYKYSMEELTA